MLQYWLWLSEKACVSKVRRLALLRALGSVEAVYFAGESELDQLADLTAQEREALLDKDLTEAEKILSRCFELDIRILTWQDAQYPGALRSIDDPPVVLWRSSAPGAPPPAAC